MISMRLVGWIPMATSGKERVIGVSYLTDAEFMDMKTVGTNWWFTIPGRLVFRQARYICTYPGTSWYSSEGNGAGKSRCQRPTTYLG